jgi:hypothetical protein
MAKRLRICETFVPLRNMFFPVSHDSVDIVPVRVERVETELILDPEQDHNTASHSDSQAVEFYLSCFSHPL